MNRKARFVRSLLFSVFALALGRPIAAQAQPDEYTICPNGCQSIVLSGGNQLIAEGGSMPNHAALIAVDPVGDQLSLPFIGGIPSGRAADGAPFGPVAYELDGRNLYFVLGEADQFHSGGPFLIRRARPAAFVSAVIQVSLSADPTMSGPFILTPDASRQLWGGQTVTVQDFSNNTATFTLLATLGAGAHPAGLATLASAPDTIYLIDSATKRLLALDRPSRTVSTVAQFPLQPESLRPYDDHQLLVTLFSATAGASEVFLLDPKAGVSHLAAGSLTSTVDAVASKGSILVLENSGDWQGLGQLLSIDSNGSATVLANGLNDPTSLAIDDFTGRIFFFSRGDGVIYSLPL